MKDDSRSFSQQRRSARFYIEGLPGVYLVTNFMEMDDVEFTKKEV